MTRPKKQDRRTFKRTTRKPAPKRKAWKRWSVEHIDYDGDFIRFDGEHVDHEDVVKLLNRSRATLPRGRR
jgi:hypothetical protein